MEQRGAMRRWSDRGTSGPLLAARPPADRFAWLRDPGWLSVILLWAAFPPLGWWWLAWVAPLGWIRWVTAGQSPSYRVVYGCSLLHWLLLLEWVRLPHWSAYFGWLALAAYLAVYLPLSVLLARELVHRWRWPSWLAWPVAWTGMELFRSWFLTGFALCLVGHTQVPCVPLLQVADLAGAYGVGFVLMMVAACVERCWPRENRRALRAAPLGIALLVALAAYGYGSFRVRQLAEMEAGAATKRTFRAALIQGSFDTQFDGDAERPRRAFLDYARLSREAAAAADSSLDLVVWPESMFTAAQPMISYEEPLQPIEGWELSVDELRRRLDELADAVGARGAWVTQQTKTPLLAGLEWNHLRDGREIRYNSAIYLGEDGKLLGRYDKMHRVMFGEYVPLGEWLPWLYRLTPMPDGLTPGTTPQVFEVGNTRVAPMICFENTVPHLVRRHVRQLTESGKSPDVLVTITNDGWFWGSSALDLHLACGVFRAVEMRRPMLIAANTGFSAWIDAAGRTRERGPRRAEGVVQVAQPLPERPAVSFYLRWGDLLPGVCLLANLLAGAAALARWVGVREQDRKELP